MKSFLAVETNDRVPKDLSKNRIKACYDLVATWVSMFENSDICVISSVVHGSGEIEEDLLRVHYVGKKNVKDFTNERIESRNNSFYEPLKKNKMMKFASSVAKIKSKGIKAEADCDMF